jgi:hypothetical protein
VWRLYNLVDIHSSTPEQRAIYDDGIGTEDFKPLKVLGGAFGWGLSRNIRELYTFLVTNYRAGDRIYLFGFSRGAFTVRALAGMIAKCGLWDRQEYFAHQHRQRIIRRILWAYREDGSTRLQQLRAKGMTLQDVPIKFIGVWDTVDAVGMPIDELQVLGDRLLLWLPKQSWRLRLHGFHDRKLSPKVEYARQALAIDDERRTFHPNIWEQRDGIEQVWFAGAHSNIGGGYDKDGLSYVSLDWMMAELDNVLPPADRIRWLPGARQQVIQIANEYDKHYDPRAWLGGYYRYSPRRLAWFYSGNDDFYQRLWRRLRGQPEPPVAGKDIKIHISVWRRIVRASQDYGPLFLPAQATWVGTQGSQIYGENLKFSPCLPEAITTRLTRLILIRQVAYLIFVGASLLGLTLGYTATPASGSTLPTILEALVPTLAHRHAVNAVSYPWYALPITVVALLGAVVSWGLGKHIHTLTARAWQDVITAIARDQPLEFRRSLEMH